MQDDSLMQSLCGDFTRTDYSRWERRPACGCGHGGASQRGLRTLPDVHTRRARRRGHPGRTSYPLGRVAGHPQELSSTRPGAHEPDGSSLDAAWPSQAQVLGASCSVLCRHPWVERPPPPPPPPDIPALLKRMADVKVLEKAQALLEDLHGRQMLEAIADERRMEDAMREDVAELERRVQQAEVQLEEARARLRSLRAYRSRERPLQAVRQAQLQRQLQALQRQQEAEEAEERRRHEERLARIAAHDALTQEATLSRVAQEHLEELPHDLQTKSFQNTSLRKEIEIQGKEVAALRLLIPALQQEVRQLAARARKQRHTSPRLLPSDRKLSPDEEVELDIPRDEVLPF